MCSAIAPGPCKVTRGSGKGSREQHRFPLPSKTTSTEDPGAPPTFTPGERHSAAPSRGAELQPARPQPVGKAQRDSSRGAPPHRPGAAAGSPAVSARVRTDPGLQRVRAPTPPHGYTQLCVGRSAPGTYRGAGRGGTHSPAPPHPLEARLRAARPPTAQCPAQCPAWRLHPSTAQHGS